MNTREVAKAVGLPQRTVASWVSEGLLRPDGARGGRHRPAQWKDSDLVELGVLRELRHAGLSLQTLRDCIRYLRDVLHHNPLSSGTFFVFGRGPGGATSLVKVCGDREAIEILRSGRGQMVLPVFVEQPTGEGDE